MVLSKKAAAYGIVFAMVIQTVASWNAPGVRAASPAVPTLVMEENFAYSGKADGTDFTSITEAMQQNQYFSTGFLKDLNSALPIDAGTFGLSVESNPELGGYAVKALKNAPGMLGRKIKTDSVISLNSDTQLYYITWYQFVGENDTFKPNPNIGNPAGDGGDTTKQPDNGAGQFIAFSNAFNGGGFQTNGEGKTLPFVAFSRYSTGVKWGTKEIQKGKWYRMVMRMKPATGNATDSLALKVYPLGEQPPRDWDAELAIKASSDWNLLRFQTATENTDSTQKFAKFKVERYQDGDVQTVITAEDAVKGAYTAVQNGASDAHAKLTAANTALSNLGDGAAKSMLLGEMDGLIAARNAQATAAVVSAEQARTQAAVDTARILVNDLTDEVTKASLNTRLDAVVSEIAESVAQEAVEKAEATKKQPDVDDARIWVNALGDPHARASLQARLDAVQVIIDNTVPTIGNVTISGSITVGGTLTAGYQYIADPCGNSAPPGYQWYRDNTLLINETGSTYTVKAEDVGTELKVVVTAKNNKGKTGNSGEALRKINKSLITVYEDFNYETGRSLTTIPQLTGANPEKGFSTGWMSDPNLTTPVADSNIKIDGNNMLAVPTTGNSVNIYRGISKSIKTNAKIEYFIKWKQYLYPGVIPGTTTSQKLEFDASTNAQASIMFGIIGDTGDTTKFAPYIKVGPTASPVLGGSNKFNESGVYHLVARVSMNGDGTAKAYLKVYPDGADTRPQTPWDVSLSLTLASELDKLLFSSNLKVAGTPKFGAFTLEEYGGSDYTTVQEAEQAVSAAVTANTMQAAESAKTAVNKLPDGIAKDDYLAKLYNIQEPFIQEANNISTATALVTTLEGTVITADNVNTVSATVDQAKAVIAKINNTGTKNGLAARLSIIEKTLNEVKIKAHEAVENFEYTRGTKLKDTTAGNYFNTGWKADPQLTGALDDSYEIAASGIFKKSGPVAMYRGLSDPISLADAKEYYVKWNFKVQQPGTFSGLVLGNYRFGVSAASGGFTAMMNNGEALKGTELLEAGAKYTAVLKIEAGTSRNNAYLMIYPYEGQPKAEWDLSAQITDNAAIMQTIGVLSDCGEFELYNIHKQEVNSSYIAAANTTVNTAKASVNYGDIAVAEDNVTKLTDCIAKTLLNAAVKSVKDVNKQIVPKVDWVTIDGSYKTGGVLTAKYDMIDTGGNKKDPVIKWLVGSAEVGSGSTLSVSADYGGKTVSLQVTPVNLFDVYGIPKESTAKIEKEGTTGGGSYGGGGKGGSKSGGSGGGVILAEPPEETYIFTDIKNHWAKNEINRMAELGIIKGSSKDFFSPDDLVTRAEFAALIGRIIQAGESSQGISFGDVSENDWFAKDIEKIAAAKIMIGNKNSFNPNAYITREEMAKAILGVFEYMGAQSESGADIAFTDADQISDWALPYVQQCGRLKLMSGMSDGSFAPKELATRAQAAVVIDHLLRRD